MLATKFFVLEPELVDGREATKVVVLGVLVLGVMVAVKDGYGLVSVERGRGGGLWWEDLRKGRRWWDFGVESLLEKCALDDERLGDWSIG